MQHTTTVARRGRALATGVGATLALLALAACSGGDGAGGDDASSGSGGTVTLVTHDSFAVSDDVLAAFEEESGLTVEQVAPGDGARWSTS
nr:hypothetical protein [Cellulosimicrobium sp. MM]